MAGLSVVHVIERLRPGGPIQALVGLARQDTAGRYRHRLISLLPADAGAVALAAGAGIQVASSPDPMELDRLLAEADIVQAHFWNSPALHAWLAGALPAMRLLVWCHVNGLQPPQVIPAALFQRADRVAATSEVTLDLPVFQAVPPERRTLLFAGADFSRLDGLARVAHDGCHVAYLGLLDFAKLHADFIRLCAAVGDAEGDAAVHFHVCGDGADRGRLEGQAAAAGLATRMHFYGQVEDIRPLLARCDVFGYPLCPETYCTAELALQEAMHAGLPPVVFPHGGLDRLVRHGVDGLVAPDGAAYVQALQGLAADPGWRRRLGANAAAQARARFGGMRTLADATAVYADLPCLPKRARPAVAQTAGAAALLASLDGQGDGDLRASLDGDTAAEARIANAGPNWRQVILQYRLHYPDDPHLRLWAGLLLRAAGRPALAAGEFKAAFERGLERARQHYATARAAA